MFFLSKSEGRNFKTPRIIDWFYTLFINEVLHGAESGY